MSRLVWGAALALVAVTGLILWWFDRADDRPPAPALPPIRTAHPTVHGGVDGGRALMPHPDRVGLPHRLPE